MIAGPLPLRALCARGPIWPAAGASVSHVAAWPAAPDPPQTACLPVPIHEKHRTAVPYLPATGSDPERPLDNRTGSWPVPGCLQSLPAAPDLAQGAKTDPWSAQAHGQWMKMAAATAEPVGPPRADRFVPRGPFLDRTGWFRPANTGPAQPASPLYPAALQEAEIGPPTSVFQFLDRLPERLWEKTAGPALVAPEGLHAQQSFCLPGLENSRARREPTRIRHAARPHRPAAQRFLAPVCAPVAHPRLVLP